MIVFLCGPGNKVSATVGVSSVFEPLVAQFSAISAGRFHRQSHRPAHHASLIRLCLRLWLHVDSGSGGINGFTIDNRSNVRGSGVIFSTINPIIGVGHLTIEVLCLPRIEGHLIVFLCGPGNKFSATVGVSSVFVPLVAQVTTIWAGRFHPQSHRPRSVTSSLRAIIL